MAAVPTPTPTPFPWLSAGSLLAGPVLNTLFPKAFGGDTGFKGFDPTPYKDQIVVDEGDASAIRQNILSSIQKGIVGPGIRGVKQIGAAGRLPKGTTQSAIAGVVGKGSKAVSQAEPGIQELRRKSMMDFLNLKRDYINRESLHDMYTGERNAAMLQGSLGGLSKLMMLWQGGLFDKPSTPGLNTGGQ